MQKNSFIKIVLVLGLAIASMWGGFQLSQYLSNNNQQPPIIEGTYLKPPRVLSDFTLIDQDKKTFGLEQFKGNWSFVFFGYTNCPDVCPNTLGVLRQSYIDMQALQMQLPQVVFVSIDPERDTPEVMASYVHYFDPSFIGVTGEKAQLFNLSKQLSALFLKAAGASGDIRNDDYLFDHSAAILLINPKAELQAVFTAPHNKLGIVDGLQQIMKYYQAQ